MNKNVYVAPEAEIEILNEEDVVLVSHNSSYNSENPFDLDLDSIEW